MLICGSARSPCTNARAARLAGDVVGRRGHDLHQALGAGVRGLVAEARLDVDHARDQRRVEALVGRLLADDVLVAQRERDLLHGLVGPRLAAISNAQRRGEHGEASSSSRRRSSCGGAAAGLASAARRPSASACVLCAARSRAQLRKHGRQRLLQLVERAGVLRPRYVARCGLLLLPELASCPLVDRLVPAGGGALAPDVVVGDDRDRGVEAGVHAGLEQQRHLDDERRRRRLARGLDRRATRRSAARRAARAAPPATRARRASANARRATAARSTTPPGATSSPQRATTAARTSGSE